MDKRFAVTGDSERLDRFLQQELQRDLQWEIEGEVLASLQFSRSQVERLIESGQVSVNGKKVTKPAYRVQAGDTVVASIINDRPSELKPFEFKLSVLFEDEYLIVIDKPAGLSMHPGAGNRDQTLANALVSHIGSKQRSIGEIDRPGIVHRLDKDTTGVVVVAKSIPTHASLAKQFAERSIDRSYAALVFTTPKAKRAVQLADSGEVSGAIGRHPTQRTIMAIVDRGKPALTRWRVLERFAYGTLLECRLHTGRTHQIRVHLTSIGSPIIGDKTYGDFCNLPRELREAGDKFGRQALHAATLSFTHPVTGGVLSFESPLPSDFSRLLSLFRRGTLG